MRAVATLVLLTLTLLAGCKKKTPPTELTTPPPSSPSVPATAPSTAAATLLKQLAKTKREAQLATADRLADLAENDPEVIPGLIALLKDKTNLGEGQVMAHQPNSVREAAVIALIYCGEPGEKAAVEQGLPILLTGLTDPAPAVREHTLIALSRLKMKGASAIAKVWPLAEDPSAFVRDAAYHCLRELGDKSGSRVATLLSHADMGVRTTAAEQLPTFLPLPTDALEPLRTALKDENKFIRTSAAEALGFGPKAAAAVPDLAGAIRQAALDSQPNVPFEFEMAVLNLLVAIGPGSIDPIVPLLKDKNPLVVLQALYVLGEIGLPAKSAAKEIQAIVNAVAQPGEVRLEACRALATITGDSTDTATLMKLALEHKEAATRNLGLQTASRMGPPGRRFAEQIFLLLDDPEPIIRRQAIAYVATLDDKRRSGAVPKLAKLLKDESANVRTAAVNALADFGLLSAPAAEELAQAATSDDDNEVRQTAMNALADLGPAGVKAKAPVLATIENAKATDELRATALRVYVGLVPAESATAAVVLKMFDSRSTVLREAAASVCLRLKPITPEIVAKLAALASQDSDLGVKIRCVRAPAEIESRPSSILATIDQLAKSKTLEIAFWAKLAQARNENRTNDVERLIHAARKGRYPEQLVALDALGLFVPVRADDFAAVDKLSRAKDSTTRQRATEALGRFSTSAEIAVPRLIELIQDRDDDVRVAAIQSLGRLPIQASAAAIPALKRQTRDDTRTSREARRLLVRLESDGNQ